MKLVPSMRQFGKSFVQSDEPQMIIQYGACVLHAEKIDTNAHTHTQTLRINNTKYLLLMLGKDGYANTLHCYVTCTLPVLLTLLCTVHIVITSSSSASVVRLNIFMLTSARTFYELF